MRILVSILILSLILAAPAYSQEKLILQLQADMIRLSQQMNQLQASVDEKNAVLRTLVEKMADQVNGLSGNVQRISEAVSSSKTTNDKTMSELRIILTNLDRSVGDLQEGMSAVRTQVNSVSQQVATKATVESLGNPDDVMRTAKLDYLAGNYDLAISGFQEYLQKFPNDPRSSEAQLFLGEAYYNQKKFEPAVVEYDLVLQKYPGSEQTRTALYKKGLALADQKQLQPALDALNRVVKEFPNTSEAVNAQAKIRELSAARRR